MIPPLAIALWFKSSFDKLACWILVLYALRHKDNVAAEYAHGSFKLVATGTTKPKKLP
jgi:hypothetical protein